jgi:hypothetical protein
VGIVIGHQRILHEVDIGEAHHRQQGDAEVSPGEQNFIPAAVAGHGVALGRSPLVRKMITSGEIEFRTQLKQPAPPSMT